MEKLFDPKVLLKSRNLRATPGRIAILKELAKAERPLTVAKLRERVGISKLDLATFYRALEIFISLGIAERVSFGSDKSSYHELARGHHHYVVCDKCGKIKTFSNCGAENLSRSVLKQVKDFASINKHSFELFGICNSCKRAF